MTACNWTLLLFLLATTGNAVAAGRLQLMATFRGHVDQVSCVAFAPSGDLLASCSHDGIVRLWDIKSKQEGPILSGNKDRLYSVAFSSDGSHLFSGGQRGVVNCWDVRTRKKVNAILPSP